MFYILVNLLLSAAAGWMIGMGMHSVEIGFGVFVGLSALIPKK